VHLEHEALDGEQAGVLGHEGDQIVLDEVAHARVTSKVAVVLEDALDDLREHFDDDLGAGAVAAMLAEEVADLWRRMVLFEQRAKAHNDLLVDLLG